MMEKYVCYVPEKNYNEMWMSQDDKLFFNLI